MYVCIYECMYVCIYGGGALLHLSTRISLLQGLFLKQFYKPFFSLVPLQYVRNMPYFTMQTVQELLNNFPLINVSALGFNLRLFYFCMKEHIFNPIIHPESVLAHR